ncbi:ribbon-helix-helix protein, CopG family [Mycolicibacterium sp. 018/SC-01/001]|uniref:CopG family ribbon-helix-helix protein n=1 Tax=Mycolicibacterium sp. 018/SC-01/001 TaxID=2592069 RepID=UPI00117F72F2|nr:ribbon-helix-helix protein, CopG family [Mycolicibacterium sp. 018/SC-01/001]
MTPAGRPEIGQPINIRLGNELLAEVDAFAETEGIKRAEAIRQLVQRGLRRNKR